MHILTSFTDYFTLFHQGRFVFVSKNLFLVLLVNVTISTSFQRILAETLNSKLQFFLRVKGEPMAHPYFKLNFCVELLSQSPWN